MSETKVINKRIQKTFYFKFFLTIYRHIIKEIQTHHNFKLRHFFRLHSKHSLKYYTYKEPAFP